MLFFHSFAITFAFAGPVLAGLVAIREPVSTLESHPILDDRQLFSAISLANFDLATSKQNQVLFEIAAIAGVGAVKVSCVDCRTWGSVIASTTGAEKDDDLIGNIIDFFKDPAEAIVNAFSVDLKLELDGVGGHFEFGVNANAALAYSIPIFQSLTPIGAAIGNDVSIGIVFSVELAFSVTAGVDLSAGFDFSFPENTFITVDPLTGEIKEDGFLDGEVDPLPITVTSGSATFKAALKVKLQAGITADLFDTGFDFQLGVFANLIEYIATMSSSEKCDLLITEVLDVNVGAFVQNVIDFNFFEIGGIPPVVTTLLAIPLPSLCVANDNKATSTTLPAYPQVTSTETKSSGVALLDVGKAAGSILSTFASPASSGEAPLVTSTVYTTDIITVYACASALINCPESLGSKVVMTSSKVLYTTICTAGASLPTTLPASLKIASKPSGAVILKAASPAANSKSKVSLHFTHLATPIVEILYVPTFQHQAYTMPSRTIAIANPGVTEVGKGKALNGSEAPASTATNGTRVGKIYGRAVALEANQMSATNKNIVAAGSWISCVLAFMVAAWVL